MRPNIISNQCPMRIPIRVNLPSAIDITLRILIMSIIMGICPFANNNVILLCVHQIFDFDLLPANQLNYGLGYCVCAFFHVLLSFYFVYRFCLQFAGLFFALFIKRDKKRYFNLFISEMQRQKINFRYVFWQTDGKTTRE